MFELVRFIFIGTVSKVISVNTVNKLLEAEELAQVAINIPQFIQLRNNGNPKFYNSLSFSRTPALPDSFRT